MTAAEFEGFDDQQVENWLFQRFRRLCAAGYAPSQALRLAASPDTDVEALTAVPDDTLPSDRPAA
ncbi:MAG TPA: hypothetical protein VEH52_03915 [Gaiellaceae bacterium]|jgi:hypothetical protein|nr:hypothetical protein [Gaiellaceae bacterium]